MKLTTARLKKLIREELGKMNEQPNSYEYEAKEGESAEKAEEKMLKTSRNYDVVMIKVPMSMKDEYIKHFGDKGRHGPIDDEYYSLTFKN